MRIIEVQGIPPSFNEFYSGTHWSKRNRLKDEWHWIFRDAIVKAKIPKKLLTPISVSVTQFCQKRMRDVDNTIISAKFFLDTLKELEYIVDDSPKYVTTLILSCKKGETDKTVITIFENFTG